jgi:hypothetical protein
VSAFALRIWLIRTQAAARSDVAQAREIGFETCQPGAPLNGERGTPNANDTCLAGVCLLIY